MLSITSPKLKLASSSDRVGLDPKARVGRRVGAGTGVGARVVGDLVSPSLVGAPVGPVVGVGNWHLHAAALEPKPQSPSEKHCLPEAMSRLQNMSLAPPHNPVCTAMSHAQVRLPNLPARVACACLVARFTDEEQQRAQS